MSCTSPSSLFPTSKGQRLAPGKLRIQVQSCFLNVPIKRPYVILTMGDQIFQTSVSEYPQGKWHETFEFRVSFHSQLFGTLQIDLYDSYMLLPDKHVGRAEIRLKTLEQMPETFTTYFEIWEKKLSTGASSKVGRAKTMATNVGAIQAKISYAYQAPQNQAPGSGNVRHDRSTSISSTHNTTAGNAASDDQLVEEFRMHLKYQRELSSVTFRKYVEGEGEEKPPLDDGLDYPDESESSSPEEEKDNLHRRPISLSKQRSQSMISSRGVDTADVNTDRDNSILSFDKMSNTLSSWFGIPTTSTSTPTTKKYEAHEPDPFPSESDAIKVFTDDDESLKTFPLLDTIGSWTVNKETNQVLRTILKMLAAFGQGFELSNLQILTGFTMLEKFYNDLPRDRTWDIVEDLSEIELAAHFWKFSVASYGWKGLNFLGKGNGYITDAMRQHSDALSIIEYLSIPKEDLLAYEFRSAQAFRPSYFIARDRTTNSIVLCIRGTMSVFDTMTDLVCEYEQWRGGLVHKGMKSAATWFFRHVAPKLVAYVNEHSTTALYIVGHSLGAATAAILTIMLLDFMDEIKKDKKEEFTLRCFGYAPACGLSLDLSEKYKDYIQSIVFADDVVSKLSYGSMMDVKELVIASAEAAQSLGIGQLLWTGKPEGKQWKAAFDRIAECRRRCLESLENPRLYVAGKVYQFWLDPAPHNDTRIVIERTDARRVSSEVIVRRSIVLDHLPTNFDVTFRRAREALMLQASQADKRAPSGVLDDQSKDEKGNARHSLEEKVLKGTTHRSGGEGNFVSEDRR